MGEVKFARPAYVFDGTGAEDATTDDLKSATYDWRKLPFAPLPALAIYALIFSSWLHTQR